MLRTMMTAKLHRAIVTEANLNYMGSITIDEALLDAVGLLANEQVQVVNNNNGARFETYIIPGKRGSKTICLNGSAARLVQPGDAVIIMAYGQFETAEAIHHVPKVAILNPDNTIRELIGTEQESTTLM